MKKILIIFTILAGLSVSNSQAQTFITAGGVHLSWQLPLAVVDVVNYDYADYVWVHTERIRFNGRLRFRLILKDGPSYIELYLNRHGYVIDRLYHDYYPLVNHTCYDCGYHSYYYHNFYYPTLISFRVRPHYYYHRPYYSFRYVHNYNHFHHHKQYYRERPVSRRYHHNHHKSRRDSYGGNKTYRKEGTRVNRTQRNNGYNSNRSSSNRNGRVQGRGSSASTYRNRPESTRTGNYRNSQATRSGKSGDYRSSQRSRSSNNSGQYQRSRQHKSASSGEYRRSTQSRTGSSSRGSKSQAKVKQRDESSKSNSSGSQNRRSRSGRGQRTGGR